MSVFFDFFFRSNHHTTTTTTTPHTHTPPFPKATKHRRRRWWCVPRDNFFCEITTQDGRKTDILRRLDNTDKVRKLVETKKEFRDKLSELSLMERFVWPSFVFFVSARETHHTRHKNNCLCLCLWLWLCCDSDRDVQVIDVSVCWCVRLCLYQDSNSRRWFGKEFARYNILRQLHYLWWDRSYLSFWIFVAASGSLLGIYFHSTWKSILISSAEVPPKNVSFLF